LSGSAALGNAAQPEQRKEVPRRGDEIVICGEFHHTTARVVLWTDKTGYNAYRSARRIVPGKDGDQPAARLAGQPRERNFAMRRQGLTAKELDKVRSVGWDLRTLQRVVDQLVIHFDARGSSRGCFEVLQQRGLSVHFMLDLDGTIYQTLDLKESAWHATIANNRSIGIEIANIGAFPVGTASPLARWYRPDAEGKIRIVEPESARPASGRAAVKVLRPARNERIAGTIQGKRLEQYDFTNEQYDALARLTATLCGVFPKIRCDYPRDASGLLLTHKLPPADFARYQGILGHYHVQANKVDPGPAFQWDRLIESARRLMKR
jgi:N-acetyl-anhydromuramyl-L-alanine amidase AmpD